MKLGQIRAIAAVLSYVAILSLAAYNLHGELLGKAVSSAHADSAPAVSTQTTPEPAASNPAGTSEPKSSQATSPQPISQPQKAARAGGSPVKPERSSSSSRVSQSSIPIAGNGSVHVGERLPDFFLVGLNGNTLNESVLRGHKTLFIVVSPTCPHCQKELALLHQIETDFPSIEPMFASVAPVDQTRPLAAMTGEGDHLYAGAMDLAKNLGVGHVPFIMLIDEKGVVRWIKEGELDENAFRDILGRFGRGEAVSHLRSITVPNLDPDPTPQDAIGSLGGQE